MAIKKHKLQRMKLSDIRQADYNPRLIAEDARAGLRASLKRFGAVEPLVWNQKTKTLVGGHQRLSLLLEEGETHADVVVVNLPRKDEKALNVALNSPHIAGEFTDDLQTLLLEIKGGTPDLYDDLLLDRLSDETDEDEDPPEDKPPAPKKKAVTKRGDLWTLGDHKLLCGSSTDEADVRRLMGRKRAALFATDPPYAIGYDGMQHPSKFEEKKAKKNKDSSNSYHEWDSRDDGARSLYHAFMGVAKEHAIDDRAAWYCWHAHSRQAMLEEVWREHNVLFHQQIIWWKSRPILTYAVYMWAHEQCAFGWVKGKKPRVVKGAKYPTTVWEIPSSECESDEHPTCKPIKVFTIPMKLHTKKGDVCYEPFSGSGSQIIAAEHLGRRCFALEIEPLYCDVAVERWQELTGRKARRTACKS